MYCSKCKFTSFDHVPVCPKCGLDWKDSRDKLNVTWLTGVGFNWFSGKPSTGPDEEEIFTGSAQAGSDGKKTSSEDTFAFDQPTGGSAMNQTQSTGAGQTATLGELSFEEFEEVNIGEADHRSSPQVETLTEFEEDSLELTPEPASMPSADESMLEVEEFSSSAPAAQPMQELESLDQDLGSVLNEEAKTEGDEDLEPFDDLNLDTAPEAGKTDLSDISLDELDLELEEEAKADNKG